MRAFTRDAMYLDVEGLSIGGWLYVPDGAEEPRPAVTMGSGFTGVEEVALHRVAEFFAGAGFVVLLHDHPNFGSSEGEPRREVDPWRQIEAWRQA